MINKITNKEYDCIVVGAGPGGCSAAYFLAKQGHEVLLVDKASFPRDKVCGDGITPSGVTMLDRMGVLGEIEKRKPYKIEYGIITSPDNSVLKSKIPKLKGLFDYSYAIPRMELDKILFDHVKAIRNVSTLEQFKVIDLFYNNNEICGVTGKFGDKLVSIKSKYIIGADGTNSVITKRLNLLNKENNHRYLAIRAYFENVSGLESAFELYFDSNILPSYGWIFPVSKDKANVGIGIVMKKLSNNDKKPKEILKTFIEKNNIVKDKLKNAHMIKGSLKGGVLPVISYTRPRCKDNVLLVGDAGSMVDTLTGEGIPNAIYSGECAANAISKALTQKKYINKAGKIYKQEWKYGINWLGFKPISKVYFFLFNKTIINFLIGQVGKTPKRADIIAKAMIKTPAKKMRLIKKNIK